MTIRAHLQPLSDAAVASWREDRAASGRPLPESTPGDGWEAHEVVVDDVPVGGLVLVRREEDHRWAVRELQTTLPHDARAHWASVVAAIEARARDGGATSLVVGVPPSLAPVFDAAGFGAVMATVSKRLDPDDVSELQDDRRVAVREMEPGERGRFVAETRVLLRSGMDRAGVQPADVRLDALEHRLRSLVDEPPLGELLLVGTVGGETVARLWATLRPASDGATDFSGHTLDVVPEHRGKGLTTSFLGAIRRHLHDLGVRDVHIRVYGHDERARTTLLGQGMRLSEVQLRKDLTRRA